MTVQQHNAPPTEPALDLEGLREIARANVRPDYWPDAVAAKEFAEKYPATFLALIAKIEELQALSTPSPERAEGAPAAEGLHPATRDLVSRFMNALAAKLAQAEAKYGYSDGWADPSWEAECRRQLHHHAAKGDPRDVAAYAAFCWHHGWSTSLHDEAARNLWSAREW